MRENKKKDRVGWTAYYTSAVWAKHGTPESALFLTRTGKILNWMVTWGGGLLGLYGNYSVSRLFLLPRHLGINALIEKVDYPQIVELAAGLSARGLEWSGQHSGCYLEIDQTAVISRKKALLSKAASVPPDYALLATDLLKVNGPELKSLVLTEAETARPTLLIAEGLTGYLDEQALRRLLQLIREVAACFEDATVLVDLYLQLNRRDHGRVAFAMTPARWLWRLLRAPMRMFLRDEADIRDLLKQEDFEIQNLYSSLQLAELAGLPAPAVNLFYLAELKIAQP
ncbi:MAG TPA: class I SAM-dependent methyltransferase [Chloroflexia bacterium]|nr:class I SAM-dependent methyltransferase [Chloroflexia bacterium]